MQTAVLSREEKGRMIAEKANQIQRLDDRRYKVASQNGHGMYDITRRENGSWLCTCYDFYYRGIEKHEIIRCKHIWAVELSLKLREHVQARVIEPITDIHTCIYCKSENFKKEGLRHNKYGDIQKFYCKNCGKWFTINFGFERMKHSSQGITTAMQLYFSGESLRNTQKFLRLQGVQVSHVAIYNWISKYVVVMEKYLEQIKPQVSDVWRADELYLKIKGNMKYLFAMMDDQTRFLIAQEVAEAKYTHDARHLFQISREAANKQPKILITDGLPAYRDAFMKEYWTRNNGAQHIREIQLAGRIHNNKMERLNGEIRDREKVMRGLEKVDTPILSGYQIYHNYVRPHEGLEGKTPAEAAGIDVRGQNKWVTIIQNASKK
jgi:transposase-like protein